MTGPSPKKWFKCFVAGENFPGELVGSDTLIGFYTTRFVLARDAADAESRALNELKTERKLKLPDGVAPDESARVYFEEIVEARSDEVSEAQQGFVFYDMERDP